MRRYAAVVGISWLTAFLDFPEEAFEAGCRFWCAVTNSRLSPLRGDRSEFATLLPEAGGDPFLRVQRLARGQVRCHLDVHAEDTNALADRALELGARLVERRERLVLLESPAGSVFCVMGDGGEARRPPPEQWPAGQRSLVDQLCVDVPGSAFETEASFWAELTGWERRSGTRPEFEFLARPPGMPLRLLLQRLGKEQGEATAHLDLACDDLPAEIGRHESLGATVVRTMPHWTTLRDPVGLLYCVTQRDPDTGTLPSA
jgi:hypothetical protein